MRCWLEVSFVGFSLFIIYLPWGTIRCRIMSRLMYLCILYRYEYLRLFLYDVGCYISPAKLSKLNRPYTHTCSKVCSNFDVEIAGHVISCLLLNALPIVSDTQRGLCESGQAQVLSLFRLSWAYRDWSSLYAICINTFKLDFFFIK